MQSQIDWGKTQATGLHRWVASYREQSLGVALADGDALDLARKAEQERDWQLAEHAWHDFLKLDNSKPWAHLGLSRSLREQGRFDEAAAVLEEAIAEFSSEIDLFVEHARLAEQRGDRHTAVARWRRVCGQWPEIWTGHRGLADLLARIGRLDEARNVLALIEDRFSDDFTFWHDVGRLAERQHDWLEAERAWRQCIAANGQLWQAHTAIANSLWELGQIDEANRVLNAAVAELPPQQGLLVEHAQFAERTHDWEVARARWQRVREQWPTAWVGHGGLIGLLRRTGRLDEAREAFAAAEQQFPDDSQLWHDLGRFAEQQRDWVESERAWRRCLEVNGRMWQAYTSLAISLRELGQTDEADRVLDAADAAMAQAAPGPALLFEFARVTEMRNKWQAASELWRRFHEQNPEDRRGVLGLSRTLRLQGKQVEARRHLLANLPSPFKSVGDAIPFLDELGALDLWSDAVAILEDLAESAPDSEQFTVQRRLADSRLRLLELDELAADAPQFQATVLMRSGRRERATDARRDVMMAFENFGSGCEFAGVQSRFYAEPLGLLRWAGVSIDKLLEILEDGFAGIGGENDFELRHYTHPGGREEHQIFFPKYGLHMHSHVWRDEEPADILKPKLVKRIKYLRNKLLTDLQTAEKIFVYTFRHRDPQPAELERLGVFFPGRPGPVMLVVLQATSDSQPQTIDKVSPGIWLGRIDFSLTESTEFEALAEQWFQVCDAALSAFIAEGAEPVATPL